MGALVCVCVCACVRVYGRYVCVCARARVCVTLVIAIHGVVVEYIEGDARNGRRLMVCVVFVGMCRGGCAEVCVCGRDAHAS